MIPDMVYCILTRDLDFAADMIALLRAQEAEVFVATSFDEYRRFQEDGVIVEMLVVDPVFRVA